MDALVWSPLHGLLVGDKSVQVTHSPIYSLYCCVPFLIFYLSHPKLVANGDDNLNLVLTMDGCMCFGLQRSGSVPGVGLVHAPLALLPTPFPEKQCREATELDAKFLQESLSRLITWLFLNAELKTRMSTKVRGELIPVLNFALRNK